MEAQLNEAGEQKEGLAGKVAESGAAISTYPAASGRSVGIERKQAKMEEQYGAPHPLMIQLAAEKERLRREVAIEKEDSAGLGPRLLHSR